LSFNFLIKYERLSFFDQKSVIKDFSNLSNGGATTEIKAKKPDTFVTYTVQLRKGDSDVLRALAQLLSGEPEEVLVDVAVEAIKDRMKKAVNQL
jgi:hypothetical protein